MRVWKWNGNIIFPMYIVYVKTSFVWYKIRDFYQVRLQLVLMQHVYSFIIHIIILEHVCYGIGELIVRIHWYVLLEKNILPMRQILVHFRRSSFLRGCNWLHSACILQWHSIISFEYFETKMYKLSTHLMHIHHEKQQVKIRVPVDRLHLYETL